jgi:replicative superfamily II helicase
MGVNLKIRRIIFQTLMRMTSNGEVQQIDEHEIKQIAGRAGRYLEIWIS